MKKKAASATVCVVLSACGMTATQREDQAIADQAKTAMVAFSSCHERVGAKPEYVDFATAFPIGANADRATLQQKMNATLATDTQVREMLLWRTDIEGCLQQLYVSLPPKLAGLSESLRAGLNKIDDVFVRVAQRKETWSDAIADRQKIGAETIAAMKSGLASIDAADQIKIAQEYRDRQAVWAAIAAGINAAAANAPVTTTCSSGKRSTTCTTY